MGLKLLVIDDEPIVLKAIEAYLLNEDDVECVTAGGGVEGLSSWKAEHPDLTLMDLRMPVMDGIAALRQMQATGELGSHPVIILSGHIIHSERALCRELGAHAVWDKPMDPQQFLDFLDSLREQKGHE